MIIDSQDLNQMIVIGDRVLVKPKPGNDRTKSGLYLPPTVKDKESIKSGYVIKVGPGYPIPAPADVDETWQTPREKQYFPLQTQSGDLAIYLQTSSYEIEFKGEKYEIVPHNAILLLIRDEELFD
ncbi:MAG: co-chaperone GroES [Bacteroidetes bacterium]|nr:co-chaperone GroES [Bacteroidota bacterium]